jgi:hypothetical protein
MLTVDLEEGARLSLVRRLPAQLAQFEDLAFLFSSNQLNYRIAQLTFEEAAYLFGVARGVGPAQLAEIGRFKGGSTLVLATAMHPQAQLDSYDLHAVSSVPGAELDAELGQVLERYGLAAQVHLHVADSTSVEPPGPCRLIFVDGDHSYAGVRGDIENWRPALAPDGHLLLKGVPDRTSGVTGGTPGTGRLAAELDAGTFGLRRVGGAGTIADYVPIVDT